MNLTSNKTMEGNTLISTKWLLSMCLLGLSIGLIAQTDDFHLARRSIDVSASDLVAIPSSPEAAAFIQYGNNTVSKYTGMPDIAIPIHTVTNRKISHNISLSYSPGIKVNQLATEVGLGWNLNAGGVITRNVAGQPDDYITSSIGYHVFYSDVYWTNIGNEMTVKDYFDLYRSSNIAEGERRSSASNDIEDYMDFRYEVRESRLETQPDSYSFSANGLSGTIYIDYDDGSAFCVEHPDLKVEVTLGSANSVGVKKVLNWTVTDKYGTKYQFNETEITHSKDYNDIGENNLLSDMSYTSAWKLTTITSYDNKDVINFNYENKTQYTNEQLMLGVTMRRDGPNHNGSTNECSEGYSNNFQNDIAYTIEKGGLLSVGVDGDTEVLISRSSSGRQDLPGTKAISQITVYNTDNVVVNKVVLNNSAYFLHAGTASPTAEFNKRLKLESVDIFKKSPTNGNDPERYEFTYNSTLLPPRDSFAQDYWGYYNGQLGNQSLVPFNSYYTDNFTEAGDRNPSANHIKAATLTAIKYPTGGTTEYDYDMPVISSTSSSTTTQEVYVDGWTLQGGLDPTDELDYLTCDDEWPVAPSSMTASIGLFQGGNYLIKVSTTGTPSTGSGPPLIQFVAFYDGINGGYCPVSTNHSTLTFSQFEPLSNATHPVTLSAGLHKIMMLNNDPGLTISMQLWRIETITSSNTANKPIGALRLTKLTDKDEDNNIAKRRYFYYDDLSSKTPAQIYPSMLETDASLSGVLHRPNIFEENFNEEEFHTTTQGGIYIDCSFLNRYSSNQATPTPHTITFGTVTEVEVDPVSGDYNGFTVSRYHNENEGLGTSPYVKTRLLNGKLKSQHTYKYDPVSNTNKLVRSEEKSYASEWLVSSKKWEGLFFRGTNVKEYNDLVIKIDGNDHYYQYQGTPILGLAPTFNPTPCGVQTSTIYDCVGRGPQEFTYQQNTGGGRYWVKDVSTTTKVYDPDNSSVFKESTVTNIYMTNGHYQVVSSEMTDDLGAVVENEYEYPNAISGGAPHAGLITDHRIAEVVKTTLKHDQILQMSKETNYALVSGKYLPDEVVLTYYEPGSTAQTSAITIDSYNPDNRVRQMTDKAGIVHTYLYDDESQYVVAEIAGATYSEVMTELNNASFDYLSDTQHNTLVDGLPNAVVTSYEMQHLVGMTKKRDPNGNILFYDYDTHNRLYRIRQKLRGESSIHILEEYEYNYGSN